MVEARANGSVLVARENNKHTIRRRSVLKYGQYAHNYLHQIQSNSKHITEFAATSL